MENPLRTLPLGQAFKTAFVGWAVGALAVMVIPLGFVIITEFIWGSASRALLGLVMLPVIAALQGAVVGGGVFIGLAVFRKVIKERS